MLELHTMAPAWGLPTSTPFGLKLIAYMRLSRIPFECVVEHDPRQGPKGKFPWIVDGDTRLGDSHFIIEYLTDRFGDALDGGLDCRARVLAHAQRRMIEEGLCFALLYYRWTDDVVYWQAKQVMLARLPRFLHGVVRRRILRDVWGQGVRRHQRADVFRLARADLDCMATQLGEQAFMLGETPCSLDATAAAFLAVLLDVPLQSELKDYAASVPNMVRYCARMRSLCFADSAAIRTAPPQ